MSRESAHPLPVEVPVRRALGGTGSLLAGAAVALAAYAAHGADGAAQDRLAQAAAFAFAHGVALAALAPLAQRRRGLLALAAMLAGVLLFSGSLVAAAMLGLPTALAPLGGILMVGAWSLHGWDRWRG